TEEVEAPEVEAPEAPPPTEEKLQILNFPLKRFPPSSKAWEISKRLVEGFKGVENSIVGRIREGKLYVGYWPKTPLGELSQNNTKLLIIFHNMVEAYEKDTLKRVIVHGENNWFTLFNRNKMLVFIQSDTKPSERLLNLF
ncbi:MAG: hypothetical protein GWO20_17430, partial [Candidatus Korarchaeota archaeon]|nr:hypothetical protein [Candidatus Korarchaeota archaeon]NIU82008.1 hypothetical protein [Candidatus Thorarchaeota archaeon]NIW15176.1 hypothetical protein [Candidatus Thorarchaeota archaeon]NIW53166.1 hypothetical protein [Candidatus Korarchaeota archaeon]